MKSEYVLCSECQISVHSDESVLTIDGSILCYGCDSKRLIREQ